MTAHNGLPKSAAASDTEAQNAPQPNSRQHPYGVPATCDPVRITRADNGFEESVHELKCSDQRPLLWSVDDRLRLVRRTVTARVSVAHGEAYRLTLTSGRRLDIAANQQLMKLDGWTTVRGLRAGSRVAAVRRLGEPHIRVPMHDAEIIMLAHMIGDGSCVKRQPLRYASIDEANLAAVTEAAAHFGVTPVRDEYAAARVTTLRLPAPYRLTHGKRNPIAAWLDGLGLFGLRSHEKFIPPAIFALSNDRITLFLRHLWATDGSVRWDTKTAQGRVYYASTSRRLIDDVMHLLLRMGVQSRITRTNKAGYRDCWHLTIDRADNQLKFLTQVGVHGARGIKAQEVIVELAGRVRRPGTDTIPVEVWDRVQSIMLSRNWTDEDFALATNTRFDGPRMWTHAPGCTRLHKIAVILADTQLHDLATNDIYWDKVIDVVPLGRREFHDLIVEEDMPVVSQGVLIRTGSA